MGDVLISNCEKQMTESFHKHVCVLIWAFASENQQSGFSLRSDTNQAVQTQKPSKKLEIPNLERRDIVLSMGRKQRRWSAVQLLQVWSAPLFSSMQVCWFSYVAAQFCLGGKIIQNLMTSSGYRTCFYFWLCFCFVVDVMNCMNWEKRTPTGIHKWAAAWENQQSAYAKTKTQISFAVTTKLISPFVFATRILQFLNYLNPKFQASSCLLWLFRLVCVRPGGEPKLLVFSCTGSNMFVFLMCLGGKTLVKSQRHLPRVVFASRGCRNKHKLP